jgi:hypothetical protein
MLSCEQHFDLVEAGLKTFLYENHDCFEQDKILFKAAGAAPQTTDQIEDFCDFF